MERVKFKTSSFLIEPNGGLTEAQFVAKYKDQDYMFGHCGEKKNELLKEAYKIIKDKYDASRKKETTTKKTD